MKYDELKVNEEFKKAKEEIGKKEFDERYRKVFGVPCLDFVRSIVINLPESCHANCDYCIDKYLRCNTMKAAEFLKVCENVLKEFPKAKSVAITGGSLKPNYFNKLVAMIKQYLPDSYINWNTNGIELTEEYLDGISKINHINLHRNSPKEEENKMVFRTIKDVITVEDAKKLLGEKLCLRITVDESFNLDSYAKLGIPLYLNRLLPGTKESDDVYESVINKLNICDDSDIRRRNVYLTAEYKKVPVRICVGDKLSTHVPGRLPTFLNVAIIHRSGIVCGSWFEDDKVIYNPYDNSNCH